jgi:hypothetical protein
VAPCTPTVTPSNPNATNMLALRMRQFLSD